METKLTCKQEFEFEIARQDAYQLCMSESPVHSKLIYLQKEFIGQEKSTENCKRLVDTISAFLDCGNRFLSFLLVADAQNLLLEEESLALWKKALALEMTIYVEHSAEDSISEELRKQVILVNSFEIADLLLQHDVLTLN